MNLHQLEDFDETQDQNDESELINELTNFIHERENEDWNLEDIKDWEGEEIKREEIYRWLTKERHGLSKEKIKELCEKKKALIKKSRNSVKEKLKLEKSKKEITIEAYESNNQDVKATAIELGLSVSGLRARLKKYGVIKTRKRKKSKKTIEKERKKKEETLNVIRECKGDLKEASKRLGIKLPTLRTRLKKYKAECNTKKERKPRKEDSSKIEIKDYLLKKAGERGKLLTKEEERILIQRAQEGDKESIKRMVECNILLVAKIVNRTFVWAKRKIPYEDLVASGIFGIFEAIKKFDLSRDVKFSTYASWWISHAIRRSIPKLKMRNNIPTGVDADINKLRKLGRELEAKMGREINDEELISYAVEKDKRLTESRAKNALRTSRQEILSMHGGSSKQNNGNSEEKGSLEYFLGDQKYSPAIAIEENEERKREKGLAEAIRELDERKRKIITQYYLKDLTLSKIGKSMGISRERTRQLRNEAISELRGQMIDLID